MARRPVAVCGHARAACSLVGARRCVLRSATRRRPASRPRWRLARRSGAQLLARWDTFWYLDIATRGYHWNGNPLEQQNVVFFPLFPLLMRGGGVDHRRTSVARRAVRVARRLSARRCRYFWRWTADRLGPDAATGAVWLLSAFPLAVFFSAAYTESLYLLLVVVRLLLRGAPPVCPLGGRRLARRAGPAQRPAAVVADRVDRRSIDRPRTDAA